MKTTNQFIHCQIDDQNSNVRCLVTFVYGLHTVVYKTNMWDKMRELQINESIPWIILGDFNIVVTILDRVNGLPMLKTEAHDFQQCIHDLHLGQLNRRGCEFSRCNKIEANNRIYSNIDWAFRNISWFNKYSHVVADYLQPNYYDHSLILLDIIALLCP